METNLINQLLVNNPTEAVNVLTSKNITVPKWNILKREYLSQLHPVASKRLNPDIIHSDGSIERVSRVTSDLMKLAVSRIVSMCFGISPQRKSNAENDRQKEIVKYIENIYSEADIDSVNGERGEMLFASCEVVSLWFPVNKANNDYGFPSKTKLRVKNYSPMKGDELYPYFDEYEDLQCLSIKYSRKIMNRTETFFDAYTADMHVKLHQTNNGWEVEEQEPIVIGKIPAIYMYRDLPIWEDSAQKVYEIEWTYSNNGNYIRKNSKPLFIIYADEHIPLGDDEDDEDKNDNKDFTENRDFRTVLQFPQGSSAHYETWPQSTESIKFHVEKMEEEFWKELQLPDLSYEKMKSTPMSGEARKQLFVDAIQKVKAESKTILKFLNRELSVIKAFLKTMLPSEYASDIDALRIKTKIIPFTMTDWSDRIQSLQQANGGKAVMSQRETIVELGYSNDIDKTLEEIREDEAEDAAEMTM